MVEQMNDVSRNKRQGLKVNFFNIRSTFGDGAANETLVCKALLV